MFQFWCLFAISFCCMQKTSSHLVFTHGCEFWSSLWFSTFKPKCELQGRASSVPRISCLDCMIWWKSQSIRIWRYDPAGWGSWGREKEIFGTKDPTSNFSKLVVGMKHNGWIIGPSNRQIGYAQKWLIGATFGTQERWTTLFVKHPPKACPNEVVGGIAFGSCKIEP